jgi:hypothetical protein
MGPHCEDALPGCLDISSSPLHGDSLACGGTIKKAGIKYTNEKLLSLRPAQESEVATAEETAGKEVDCVLQDPVKTETPNPSDEQSPQEEASCDVLDQILVKKKKKKRSSGKNRKAAPTGFEGSFSHPILLPIY